MANSEIEIVNSALARIGEDPITSLTENRRAARFANRQYPLARDALIRSYRWNFAVKRVTLAPEATAPVSGFTNQFMFPPDALKIIGIFDEDELQQNYTASRIPHKVEGRFILTDDDTLPLIYIARITNVADFDALFVDAFAWRLAIDLSYPLTTTRKVREDAIVGFKLSIKEAKLADAIEGSPEVIESSEWIDSRSLNAPLRLGPVVFG